MKVATTQRPLRWPGVRPVLPGLAAVLVFVAVGYAWQYSDQLVRYVTHLKGSPTRTVAWTPVPRRGATRATATAECVSRSTALTL